MSPCSFLDRPVLTSTRHGQTPTSTWEYTITFESWYHGRYDDQLASADKVTVYKDEGENDERSSEQQLSEEKMGLIDETVSVRIL